MNGRLEYPEHLLSADETIQPLEFSAHTLWAEAHGLKQLLRNSDPAEIEANKAELTEAANMILAALETSQ
jgi:hypothetical protein